MDEVQRLRSMNKEKMRKKRAEQYRQREEEREEERKQRRQFSAAHRTSGSSYREEGKKASLKEDDQDKKKPASKHDDDKAQNLHVDDDKKPSSGWLSASNDSARKPKRSPPKSFMGSPGGVSVTSSLTRTPSPAGKQHMKKPVLRPWDCVDLDDDEMAACVDNDKKPRFNKRIGLPPLHVQKPKRWENDGSSDDDDLVREAKKLVVQQRKLKPFTQEPKSPSRRKKAPLPPQNLDGDSGEDDFIREARLLAQKKLKKRESTSKNPNSESSQKSSSSGNEERKASARLPRRKQKSVGSSLDPPTKSSQEKSIDSSQQQSPKSSQEKMIESSDDLYLSPSNAIDPLQPSSVNLDKSIDYEKRDSEYDEENHMGVARLPPPANADALWIDSDTEQVEVEKVPGKKRKRKQKASSDASPKKVACSPGRGVGGKRKSKARKVQDSVSGDEKDYEEDEVEGDQLKPHFVIPKLGPPSALEPLTLEYSQGQRAVPAAINRYLKGYQREGVVFMHSRVAENQGVIL
jgi:hypothetical protein